MRMTLLEMTQSILKSLDGDEVNSITDTYEAKQVAEIIRNTYYDIAARSNLPETYVLFQLDPSNNPTDYPVVMYRPDHISELLWVQYDQRTDNDDARDMVPVQFITLQDYINRSSSMDNTAANVQTLVLETDEGDFTFYYSNDAAPKYFTTYDDRVILFDSFDETVDATLQASKTMCYGIKSYSLAFTNTAVPQLDNQQFQLLLNEAKVTAFSEMKQASNQTASRWASRHWNSLQKKKDDIGRMIPNYDRVPNYGRK